MGLSGLEPPTSRLSGARSNLLSYEPVLKSLVIFSYPIGYGDDGIRTHDPLLAGQVLSQLSYTPIPGNMKFSDRPLLRSMGLSGLEPPTSRLSGVRSNRLSYKPSLFSFRIRQPPTLPHRLQCSTIGRLGLNHRVRDGYGCFPQAHRHRNIRVFKFCGTSKKIRGKTEKANFW